MQAVRLMEYPQTTADRPLKEIQADLKYRKSYIRLVLSMFSISMTVHPPDLEN
jgi:hypothetical protein